MEVLRFVVSEVSCCEVFGGLGFGLWIWGFWGSGFGWVFYCYFFTGPYLKTRKYLFCHELFIFFKNDFLPQLSHMGLKYGADSMH